MSYGRAVLIEFGLLLLKIAVVAALAVLAFTFLFAGVRCEDKDMKPAVQDGDLAFAYRMDREYAADDLCVLVFEGKKQVRRVVATAGDVVDINEDGLYINGAKQLEPVRGVETVRYETAVEFPIRVGQGQVFVLGDARDNATDSRVYGLVEVEDTLGKVMMLIRRRQF
ncbi:MAG: signal peptidase I [Lachnospiraceae bacterium]|nr:signal peptidase I [Lachnospiraceae bacterium]